MQVKDPNGRWYQADNAVGPGHLLLIAGKSLEQTTGGVRRAGVFRVVTASSAAPAASSSRYDMFSSLV